MKRFMFATMVVALLCLASWASAAVLLTENFEYDLGVLADSTGQANVSGGVWHHFSGTDYLIQCVSGSLSYAGYQASGVGNMIVTTRPQHSAEDIYTTFTQVPLGTPVYASFLLNVIDTGGLATTSSTNGDYFIGLFPNNSQTKYVARLTIRHGAADSVNLGMKPSGVTSATWSTVNIASGSPQLVMIRFINNTGTNDNDTSSLWLNPSLAGAEPVADVVAANTASDTSSYDPIGRFAIRQDSTSGARTPHANIDGIVVGTSWHDIQAVAGSPGVPAVQAFELQAARPNPAVNGTTLQYSLPASGNASLVVFNVVGQRVATLATGTQTAGAHQVRWGLRDDRGNAVPNGIYFFQLTTGSSKETRKLTVVR